MGSAEDELKQFDVEKRKLECEKLRAEIRDVSLSWWQRPTYIGSVLTLTALLTGWVSGYFPSERDTLKREIDGLRRDKENRTQDAMLLNTDMERLRNERNDFKEQKTVLEEEKVALAGDIQTAKDERDKLDKEKQILALEIREAEDKLDASYIRLRIALLDAQYAISHIDATAAGKNPAEVIQQDRERVSDLYKKLSSTDTELVRRFFQSHELSMIIADITVKDLKELDAALSSLVNKKRLSMDVMSPMEVRGNGKTYNIDAVKKADDRQLLEWFRSKERR